MELLGHEIGFQNNNLNGKLTPHQATMSGTSSNGDVR